MTTLPYLVGWVLVSDVVREGEPLENPLYQHNCDHCVFLGTYQGTDLYACESGCPGYAWPTVIARSSDEPSDYMSGLKIAEAIERDEGPSHPMVEALRRARERKLIP